MNNLNYIGIIPARFASTRFPGKPLAKIGGVMMIERVYHRVKEVLDNVYVATDDQRIIDAVESFGGKAIMTSDKHKSGTDRCLEAYDKINNGADVIINIQGDEPFISKDQLNDIINCFDDPEVEIATLAKVFDNSKSYEELCNPNMPKIVINDKNYALYFSRSVIPYLRNYNKEEWPKHYEFLTHLGMYAYRKDALAKITKLEPSSLEIVESLEQLRWLQNGYKIKVGITNSSSIGIDTPSDLQVAERYLLTNNI